MNYNFSRFRAFLSLVRYPNLVFMVLTQVLFQYCIFGSMFPDLVAGDTDFWLIVVSSVLIAAGGYVINDYFDVNIDAVNKPEKRVVGIFMHRRSAIVWHILLSVSGLFFSVVAFGWGQWYLVLANAGVVLLLWLYSAAFKRKLLVGNVVIALLTAWTILLLFLSKFHLADALRVGSDEQVKFFRLTMLYAGFAFIISLVREAIKDVEDMEGDARYGCTTMPVIWGVNVTKVYVAVWLLILLAVLVVLQFYILQFKWWLPILYCILFIIIPLCLLLKKLLQKSAIKDFSSMSKGCKLVMLSGILSMGWFYFYL